IKDMMQAVKIDADREMKIRKEAAKEAADVVTELAKTEGLTEETQQRWRERILGLTNKAA
ncbi:MAG: phage protein Gp27 family protein, partial [bacterium]